MHTSRFERGRFAIDLLTIALFLAAIVAPTVDRIVRDDDARSPRRENRKAAPRPSAPRSLAALYGFPLAYEKYFSDSFGLRDVLLRWNTYDKLLVFGVSPTPMLVVHDDGWVDYAGEGTMEILRGLQPYTTPELVAWQRYLERCQAFCARHGARYLWVICSNKETIYPEHVPERYQRVGPTRFEQLMAFLPPEVKECVVDLRPDLIAAKAHDRAPDDYLYNVAGTHWNGRGSWVAYKTIVAAIQKTWPAMQALPDEAVAFPPEPWPSGDSWGQRLYAEELFPQPSRWLTLIRPPRHEVLEGTLGGTPRWHARNPAAAGPRVLEFHDSFGPHIGLVLAESCPDLTLSGTWFDTQQILIEEPEIVLEVRVERVLRVGPFASDMGRLLDAGEDVSPRKDGELVLALDASTSEQDLSTLGMARIERTPDGLVFHADEHTGGWTLPAFSLAADQRAWLSVELESEKGGTLIAYRRSQSTSEWLRKDAGYLTFAKGRQTHTIALPGPAGPRELRLHLLGAPTRVLIKRLEVRLTDR